MEKPKINVKPSRFSFPHLGVFTRLAPSPISGVGVFAIHNIRKGTDIFPDIDDRIIWIDKAKVKRLPKDIRDLYEIYCIHKGKKYGCPVSFNRINVSWYLNHSSKPNAAVDKNLHVYAVRNIKKGEELTLDYTTFMNIIIPPEWK